MNRHFRVHWYFRFAVKMADNRDKLSKVHHFPSIVAQHNQTINGIEMLFDKLVEEEYKFTTSAHFIFS